MSLLFLCAVDFIYLAAAVLTSVFLPFCPTAHENRRGEESERGHQLHLKKEEALAGPHGTGGACSLYECVHLNPDAALTQPEEQQKEFADRWAFFQQDADSVGAEPLLPSTGGSALVSAAPHKRFCPLSITARQRWSLLSLICIGISSISIPGMTEEQTCVDGGVKGELGPRHISFNQS